MKTLINKNNPHLRITAPEIKVNIDTQTFYIGEEMFDMEDWTLVVEEPKKQTSKYLKEPDYDNYDKQVVKKMSEELAKIITDQIVEPLDLEKAADKMESKHTEVWVEGRTIFEQDAKKQEVDLEQAAIDYAFQRVDGDISRFDLQKAFKAGAEWQKKQDELTWEDIRRIVHIADMLLVDDKPLSNFPTEPKYYEEVLRLYNEQITGKLPSK